MLGFSLRGQLDRENHFFGTNLIGLSDDKFLGKIISEQNIPKYVFLGVKMSPICLTTHTEYKGCDDGLFFELY